MGVEVGLQSDVTKSVVFNKASFSAALVAAFSWSSAFSNSGSSLGGQMRGRRAEEIR